MNFENQSGDFDKIRSGKDFKEVGEFMTKYHLGHEDYRATHIVITDGAFGSGIYAYMPEWAAEELTERMNKLEPGKTHLEVNPDCPEKP